MRSTWQVALVGLATAGCGGTAPSPDAPDAAPPPTAVAPPGPTPVPEAAPVPAGSPEKAPSEPPAPATAPSDKRDDFKAKPKSAPDGKADPKKKGTLRSNTLGFPGIQPVFAQPAAQELRLHFLDVGQGDSTLIECPGGQRILVDGGSGISEGSSPQSARTHLRGALGNSMSIDMVLVSHPDRDHYNALPYLLEGVQVGHVQVVGAAGDYSGDFVGWLAALPANKTTRITTEAHDPKGSPNGSLNCGAAEIHVLSVAAKGTNAAWKSNTSSMVLMISYGEFDALLTADATTETENKIIDRYQPWWLDVELLKLGHHGSSATSTSTTWASVTAPEIAVVSSGFANGHGHPRKDVVERVAATAESASAHAFRWYVKQGQAQDLPGYNEAIYGTGTSGTITVGSNGSDYWVVRER